jgi:endonuclease-3
MKGKSVKKERSTRSKSVPAGSRARQKTTAKKKATSTRETAKRKAAPHPKATRSRETRAARQRRAARILAALRKAYPDATTALHHRSALELLVATVLSAQCTDERVNQVTPNLLRYYPDAAAFADARADELEAMIRSTGFFRAKAKSLIGIGQGIRDRFEGAVPDTMDGLLQLPGVARKTANCVLGTWFGKNEGIVVDTHVGRIALRLRLLTTARNDKDAVKIERDLMELFPRDAWTYLAHALIHHGRQVCTARRPKCEACALAPECPSAGTIS